MNICLKNFGPISTFKFDSSKELYLIYGKNSVGKSYAMYCIYSILKNFIGTDDMRENLMFSYDFDFEMDGQSKEYTLSIEKIFSKIDKKKNTSITPELCKIVKLYFEKTIVRSIENSLLNTFSSLDKINNRYSKESFSIEISNDLFSMNLINSSKGLKVGSFKIFNSYSAEFTPEDGYSLIVDGNRRISSRQEDGFSYGAVSDTVSSILDSFNQEFGRIYFLPASRSGLYQTITAFSPIIAELSKKRFYIKNKIELPGLTEPIADYFIYLSTIESSRTLSKMRKVAQRIENELLNGIVKFDNTKKKITFSPHNTDLDLDLAEASSMVAEISPIVAFFKYIIPRNEVRDNIRLKQNRRTQINSEEINKNRQIVIFIEEPEAHLYPSAQIKLMEIFSILNTYQIKIIMTSHSDYMLNKLSNLLIGESVNYEKVAVTHLIMSERGSENSSNISVDSEGIDDVFVNVSEELFEERMNLLSKK